MSDFPNEPPVAGQVAIVTGAGQGIGRGIALRLAHDRMHVVVADLKADQAEQVAAEVRALGVNALAVTMDVTKEADRRRLFEITLQTFGQLDALINNAGIQRTSGPLDVTEEHWDLMLNVNTKSVWFMCQAAMLHFISQQRNPDGWRGGRIVNLASAAGKIASTQYHPVYNVAKAGVIALTKTLAHTGAAHGVRVNCVCPGVIVTPMQDLVDADFSRLMHKPAEQIRAERMARIPMGKLGRPEEVADVIAFLVGPDSRYMTGQAINVTGGMVMY